MMKKMRRMISTLMVATMLMSGTAGFAESEEAEAQVKVTAAAEDHAAEKAAAEKREAERIAAEKAAAEKAEAERIAAEKAAAEKAEAERIAAEKAAAEQAEAERIAAEQAAAETVIEEPAVVENQPAAEAVITVTTPETAEEIPAAAGSEPVTAEAPSTEEVPAAEEPEAMEAVPAAAEAEPVAETEPAEEAEPAAEETVREAFSAKLTVKLLNKGDVHMGDAVRFEARVSEANMAYSITWQTQPAAEKNKDSQWKKADAGDTFTVTLSDAALAQSYRCVLTAATGETVTAGFQLPTPVAEEEPEAEEPVEAEPADEEPAVEEENAAEEPAPEAEAEEPKAEEPADEEPADEESAAEEEIIAEEPAPEAEAEEVAVEPEAEEPVEAEPADEEPAAEEENAAEEPASEAEAEEVAEEPEAEEPADEEPAAEEEIIAEEPAPEAKVRETAEPKKEDKAFIAEEPEIVEIEENETALGLIEHYDYQRNDDGTLTLDANGNPVALLEKGQEIPMTWLRDENGALVLDADGNPIATQTIPENAIYVQTLRDRINPNRSIDIYVSFADADAEIGAIARFVAVLNGYDSLIYTMQWQQSDDGRTWTNIAGVTGARMDIVTTEENSHDYWRVQVMITDIEG